MQNADGSVQTRARLTARPTYVAHVEGANVTFGQTLTWDFDLYQQPVVDLIPPKVGSAWVLTLIVGSAVLERTVTFGQTALNWEGLIDVDPTTLTPLPVNEQLAAWAAVRDTLEHDLDLPDLTILFENRVA